MEQQPADNNLESNYAGSVYDSSLESAAPTVTGGGYSGTRGQSSPFRFNKTAFIIAAASLGLIAVVGLGSLIFSSLHHKSAQDNQTSGQKANNYSVSSLSVDNVKNNQSLQLGEVDRLSVNGQLTVSNTLVLTPGNAPADPVVGQIYYDQDTNAPYYYDGTDFISLAPLTTPEAITSIDGYTGDVTLGDGLQIDEDGVLDLNSDILDAINNAPVGGVTSVQGQDGDVSFDGGAGISIDGTTISNTGVVGLTSGSSNVTVTNDGSGNYVVTAAGGLTNTGAVNQIALITGANTIGSSILGQSGTQISVAGSLSVTGAINGVTVSSTGISSTGNFGVDAGANSLTFTAGGRTFTFPTSGAASQVICTSGTTCAGGSGSAVILQPGTPQADSGAGSSIAVNNTGSGNLIQLQGAGVDRFTVTNTGATTIDGGLTVSNGSITTGSATQQGSVVFQAGNGKAGTVQTVNNLAQNTTYTLPDPGVANVSICLSTGNCPAIGPASGDLTGTYPSPTIAKLQGTTVTTTGVSSGQILQYNGSAWVNQAVSGDITIDGAGVATIGASTVTNGDLVNNGITINTGVGSGLSGGTTVALGTSISLSLANTSVTANSYGGTTSVPTFTVDAQGRLTAAGSATLANAGLLNSSLTVKAGTGLSGGGLVSLGGTTADLTVNYGSAAGTAVQGNTTITCPSGTGNLAGGGGSITLGTGGSCGALNTITNPTFTGDVTVSTSGKVILGATGTTAGSLVFYNTSNSHTTTVKALAPSGQDQTITIPDSGSATDEICLYTLQNCVGTGGGVTGTGGPVAAGVLPKFTGSGYQIGPSNVSDSGTVFSVGEALTATSVSTATLQSVGALAISPGGSLTAGATNQTSIFQGNSSSKFAVTTGAFTSILDFTTQTASQAIHLPNETGTVCLQNSLNCGFAASGSGVNSIRGATSGSAIAGILLLNNATTSSTTITIDNASYTAKGIAQFNQTDFSVASGVVDTIQPIALTSAVTFGSLTLGTGGNLTLSSTGKVITNEVDNTAGVAMISLNAGVGGTNIQFANQGGANTFLFPTSGGPGQVICTSGISCASGGGQAVILEPGSGVQTANANNTAVFINKQSGTGNLIQLQAGGVDALVIDNLGNATIGDGTHPTTISKLQTNSITPTAALTIGATSQKFTLQGTGSTAGLQSGSATSGYAGSLVDYADGTAMTGIGVSRGYNVGLGVPYGAPQGTVNYLFENDATVTPGNYFVCTTAGNCAGVGGSVTSPGGSPNTIPMFTSPTALGDSILTYVSGTTSINVGGNLTVGSSTNNKVTIGVPGSTNGSLAFQYNNGSADKTISFVGPASLATLTSNVAINLPTGGGTIAVSGTGPVSVSSAGVITCSGCLTGGTGGGGGVVDITGTTTPGSSPISGSLTISNATTSGSAILLDTASTTQRGVAQFNATNFKLDGSNNITTIQDIATGSSPTFANQIINGTTGLTLGSTTNNGHLLFKDGTADGFTTTFSQATLTVSSKTITVPNASGVLAVSASGGNLALSGLGDLTISNSPTFTTSVTTPLLSSAGALTITPGGVFTAGATSQQFIVQGDASSKIVVGSGGNTTSLVFAGPSGNKTITFPASTGTVCTTTTGCAGGTGVNADGTPTSGSIPKFDGTGNNIANSNLSETGTTLTYAGNAVVNAANGFTGKLIELLVNNVSKFSVDQAGNLTTGTGTINTATISGGSLTGTAVNGLNVSSGAIDTASTGTLSIGASNATLTIGSVSNTLTLQGDANTVIKAKGGGFTTTVGFSGVAPGNQTFNFDRTIAPGIYTICTTANNCAAAGAAGGDLGGSYPNPTVTGLNGKALSMGTLAGGNVLLYDGTNWVNKALSGDVTLASTGVVTIANNAVTNAKLFSSSITINTAAGSNLGGGGAVSLGSTISLSVASSPDFTGTLTVEGATATFGTTGVQGSLVLNDGAGASNKTATIKSVTGLTANSTYILPDPGGTGTDEICLKTFANCLGGGGGAANTSLSNLANPTAINRDLTFTQNSSLNTAVAPATTAGFNLTVSAGTAGSGTGNVGGILALNGGNAAGTGAFSGGAVNINGGTSTTGASGNGGAVTLQGGTANSTAGNGGATTVSGGSATVNGTGGALTLQGGSGNGGNGGAVAINGGSSSGGTTGVVKIGQANTSAVNIYSTIGLQGVTTVATTNSSAFAVNNATSNNFLTVSTATSGGNTVSINGVQPTAAATGVDAQNALYVTGAKGGNSTGVGQPAGIGGNTIVLGGDGGNGTGTNGNGGQGGSVAFLGGAGGASSGSANNSNGGFIGLQGGTAGTGGSGAAGSIGAVTLQASGGNVGIGVAVPLAKLHIVNDVAGTIATVIQGAPSQSADLLELADTNGLVNAKFNSSGAQLTLGRGSNVAGKLILNNATNNNAVTVASGATSTSYNLTLPTSAGNANDCLTNSGTAGILQFTSCPGGSGVTSIGGIDGGTYSANGASIASNQLFLQTASATHVGLVNTGTQAFAGDKTFTSDLTAGARSTYALNVTQANNVTNNNTAGLLNLTNSDTGSLAALLSVNQVDGGAGIDVAGATTTGTGVNVSTLTGGTAYQANAITTGTVLSGTGLTTGSGVNLGGSGFTSGNGFVFNTTSTSMNTGKAISITGLASGSLTGYTSSLINVNPTRTNTATSGTVTDSGNFLNLTRSNTQNGAGGTFAVTGALATLQSNCTQTAGTCTDSANILNLNQQYTNATGAVLNVQNSGSGAGLAVTTTAASTAINLSNAASFTSGTGLAIGGTANGNLTAASFTGNYINVNPSRTSTATSGSVTDSGSFLNLTRSNTQNGAGGTFNITGALATLQSNCTQTAGTCTDSSNILNVNQQYASATGAVVNIQNAGTGNALAIGTGGNVNASFSATGILTLGRASNVTGSVKFNTSTNSNAITLDGTGTNSAITLHLPADPTGSTLCSNGSVCTGYQATITASNGLGISANNVTLGGILASATTLSSGTTNTLTVASDLSTGARSNYALNITQANDVTNNNTAGLLNLTNSDTGSTAALLSLTQASGFAGSGIALTNITSGTGINLVTGLTSGTGVLMASGTLTSGNGINLSDTAGGQSTAFTGNNILINGTRTYTTSGLNQTGNVLDISRNTAITTGTLTVSGALATLQSTCTGAGACTDTSNILAIGQNYASATGNVLNVQNAGTGSTIYGNGTSTGNLLQLQTSAVDKFTVSSTGVTTVAGGQATDITSSQTTGGTIGQSLTIRASATSTASSIGANLTVQAGNDSGATNSTGGTLTLQGGNASGSGGQTGGAVDIEGGTGSTKGNITIGTSNVNGITIGSGTVAGTGAFAIYGSAASVISTNSATLAITSSNFNVATNGQLKLLGGAGTDITTTTNGSSVGQPLVVQPGTTGAASTSGAGLTLQGGNATGTGGTSSGGFVTIDGGNSTNGSKGIVSIGTGNTSAILLGGSTNTAAITMNVTGSTYVASLSSSGFNISSTASATNGDLTFGSSATTLINRTIGVLQVSSGNGSALTIQAGAGNGLSNNGGNLVLQAGARGGTSGTEGSVIVKATAGDGSAAATPTFVIQNNAGASALSLTLDTVTNNTATLALGTANSSTGKLVFGSYNGASGGGTVTLAVSTTQTAANTYSIVLPTGLPTAGGGQCLTTGATTTTTSAQLAFGNCGTVHAKSITLPAEYSGAVLDSSDDSSCTTANAGIMASGYNASSRQNFYNWSSTSGTAQCYDIVAQVPIPNDFGSWTGTPTIYTSNSSGSNTTAVQIKILDTAGVADTSYTSYSGITSTTGNPASQTFTTFNNTVTNTYTPGGYITIKLRLTSSSGINVKAGTISIPYSSLY